MPNSFERKASALNGLIIVGASVLGAFEATRIWGIIIATLMGAGLIFSGLANFCGWYRILEPRKSSQTGRTTFWIGGRDAHIRGINDYFNSQINEATNRANESVLNVEKKRHLDQADALRVEHQQMLEVAKHSVY